MSSKVDGHTHGVGCYGWHRGHYQCALDEIKRLNDALSSAWDSLNELRGDAKEAEERAFQALDRPAPETGESLFRIPGTNTGHGHVWPRPDGLIARCGGPGICKQCALDQAECDRAKAL